MDSSTARRLIVTYLMPDKCYDRIFVSLQWNAPCLKFALNRIVGFWILLDAFLGPLPQLLRILWRSSSDGLSLSSSVLQLYSHSCPVLYAVANKFPFFAWADRIFTLAQTSAIVFLIPCYRGNALKGLLLLSAEGGFLLLLCFSAPPQLITAVHHSSLSALITSKLVQSLCIYRSGSTGQLSSLSVLLSCAGSVGHALVSLQDAGGSHLSHMLCAALSCVLMAQVLCSRTGGRGLAAKKTD